MNKPLKHRQKLRKEPGNISPQYDENIKSMTKMAVDKIMEEL